MKNKKDRLDTERKLELEKDIFSGNIIGTIDSLTNIELDYVKKSIQRPYQEFKKFIYLYDNAKPKLDELLFIEFLGNLYSSSREEIIKRIQEVRRISTLETSYEVEKLKKELKSVERRINIDLKNEESKK